MHSKAIFHRDIKPLNVMKMSKNKYAMADYGEGVNLNFEEKYSKSVDFCVGEFVVSGTPCYLDPKIYDCFQET